MDLRNLKAKQGIILSASIDLLEAQAKFVKVFKKELEEITVARDVMLSVYYNNINMPGFKSKKQIKFMYQNKPEVAVKLAKKTKNYNDLPGIAPKKVKKTNGRNNKSSR